MGKKSGVCKLTGKSGTFVDCHIVPKALTYSNKKHHRGSEARFVDIGPKGPKLAHSSWYDQSLVTQEGENILSEIDNRGIDVLRRHGLVEYLPTTYNLKSEHIVRLDTNEKKALQVFFDSILWRAAESKMAQYEEVELLTEQKELLRNSILGVQQLHFKDFPKSTMVLSNLEEKVNVAPCRENGSSSLSFVVDGRSCAFDCFSFYMNGLFVRSGISQNHSLLFEGLKCRSLGYSSELNVNVEDYRTYLKPRIDHDKQFIEDKFPERLSRILAT